MFKKFFDDHAYLFLDAPQQIGGEQNLEYYSLYQQYLQMYENVLSDYIESLDVSVTEFYKELQQVRDDPEVKDKKLVHFVNYLVASTDYESFYKIMGRAAKRARQEADALGKAESKTGDESKSDEGRKAEGKGGDDDDRDSKYSHK